MQQKNKRKASIEVSNETSNEEFHQELSVSDKPSVEVKEAKVFNLEPELEQVESVPDPAGANDKTSRDSGVSDSGSTPAHEPGSIVSTRNPSDPLPQAPVKADLYTNEIIEEKKPPPYHIGESYEIFDR